MGGHANPQPWEAAMAHFDEFALELQSLGGGRRETEGNRGKARKGEWE